MNKYIIKKIKKYLIAIVIIIAVDIAIGFALEKITQSVISRNPEAMITPFTVEKVNADIIILGSSRAKHHYVSSIIENTLNAKTYNCGKDNKLNFKYSAAIFDAISSRYAPKLIIIDIDPILLNKTYADNYTVSYDLNQYYYKFPLFKEIIDRSDKLERINNLSSMYRHKSTFINLFNQLKAPKTTTTTTSYDGYKPLENTSITDPLPHEMYELKDELDLFTISLLNLTLRNANAMNIPIIFSISPQYKTSNYKSTNYYKTLVNILTSHNAILIDNGEINLISNPKYHKDLMHLNGMGAEVFTKSFVEQVKELNFK